MKETTLSHSEIFGGREVVKDSDGVREVVIPSMNVNTFFAYLKLMEIDIKNQKQEMKKRKMQQKFKKGGAI